MANVWDRQRNEDGELEPIKWYSRFETYRLLGANRSLLATYNADRRDRAREGSTSTPRSWTKNAEAWHWQERAELWDETILQEARQADADRREEWKARERDMANKLLDRALDMLKFPLAEVTRTGENGQTTIIMPVDWKAGDVNRYAEIASKLARLADDMANVRTEVKIDAVDREIEAELARLAGLVQAGDVGDAEGETDAGAAGDSAD